MSHGGALPLLCEHRPPSIQTPKAPPVTPRVGPPDVVAVGVAVAVAVRAVRVAAVLACAANPRVNDSSVPQRTLNCLAQSLDL